MTLERTSIPSVATKANGNGHLAALDASYAVEVVIVGTAPILFRRYDDASVQRKAKAAKNSESRKSDDVETYVYRTEDGETGIPARNFKACLREAGRSLPSAQVREGSRPERGSGRAVHRLAGPDDVGCAGRAAGGPSTQRDQPGPSDVPGGLEGGLRGGRVGAGVRQARLVA